MDVSQKPPMKDFEIDPSLLSKFVWPSDNIVSEFFEVLAHHGGSYEFSIENFKIEMTFPIANIPLMDVFSKIFTGKIPVDCSLFMQILLYKDIKNGVLTFGIGETLGDIIIGTFAMDANLDVGYYCLKDSKLNSLLSTSLCNAKGQWVIRTDADKYLGMTMVGPKILSDLEWRTRLANGINEWIIDCPKLMVKSKNKFEATMIGLTMDKIKDHCQIHNITINADQMIFNPNPFKALMTAHNIPVDEK